MQLEKEILILAQELLEIATCMHMRLLLQYMIIPFAIDTYFDTMFSRLG